MAVLGFSVAVLTSEGALASNAVALQRKYMYLKAKELGLAGLLHPPQSANGLVMEIMRITGISRKGDPLVIRPWSYRSENFTLIRPWSNKV